MHLTASPVLQRLVRDADSRRVVVEVAAVVLEVRKTVVDDDSGLVAVHHLQYAVPTEVVDVGLRPRRIVEEECNPNFQFMRLEMRLSLYRQTIRHTPEMLDQEGTESRLCMLCRHPLQTPARWPP